MTYRENELEDPWARTFEWIFPSYDIEEGGEQDDIVSKRQKFRDWLAQSQSKPFWICGKPGSGKSTMMKRLFHLPKVRDEIRIWAGTPCTAFGSFYFFDRGESHLQKTQEGLLRAVLHQLISQYRVLARPLRELLPAEYFVSGRQQAITWDIDQLGKAFKLILGQPSQKEKIAICLFLDGLDEYQTINTLATGRTLTSMSKIEKKKLLKDRKDARKALCSLIHDVASLSHVKVCVASRDIIEISSAFAQSPSLRLEEMTRQDIRIYVTENLNNKSIGWRHASTDNSDEISQIVEVILDKAQSVFLWVVLVIEEIIEEISDGAYTEEISALIDDIPDDLHQLYARMLSNIKDEYQSQSLLLFELIFAAASWRPLTAVTLYFAETVTTKQLTLNSSPEAISRQEALRLVDQMRVRLKTRCAGLLEISHSKGPGSDLGRIDWEPIDPGFHVQLMHQTVKDFIDEEGGLQEIFPSQSAPNTADITLRLLRASLMSLGCLSITSKYSPEWPSTDWRLLDYDWKYIYDAIHYARLLEPDENHADDVEVLLDSLDDIANKVIGVFHGGVEKPIPKNYLNGHWAEIQVQESGGKDYNCQGNFLSFVIEANLESYCRRKFRHGLQTKSGKPLLEYALATLIPDHPLQFCTRQWDNIGIHPSNPDFVRLLLELGADCNESWKSEKGTRTVWENVLADTFGRLWHLPVLSGRDLYKVSYSNCSNPNQHKRDQRHWIENMKHLISAGANVNCLIEKRWRYQAGWDEWEMGQELCVLDIVRLGLQDYPDDRDIMLNMLQQRGAKCKGSRCYYAKLDAGDKRLRRWWQKLRGSHSRPVAATAARR